MLTWASSLDPAALAADGHRLVEFSAVRREVESRTSPGNAGSLSRPVTAIPRASTHSRERSTRHHPDGPEPAGHNRIVPTQSRRQLVEWQTLTIRHQGERNSDRLMLRLDATQFVPAVRAQSTALTPEQDQVTVEARPWNSPISSIRC